ncbi:Mal-A2 [Symbiodinium sp. CCMP2456]|nr:Mal-A2 [Symbiodinium sp. CCMP2456]
MLVVNSFCQFLGVVQNNVLAWALQTGALEAGNAVGPYVISMVGFGMLFVAAIPVGCYSALGTLRDIRDLEPQLKQFDVEHSECFCCSNDHRHPDTGQKLRCDRRLVFHTLKGWYGEAGDTADEHLKRFSSTVQTSLRHKVLEGADSVIFPSRVVACMTVAACAPWFCDSLAWAKAFCLFQEELGPFSAAWRCLAVVTRESGSLLATALHFCYD